MQALLAGDVDFFFNQTGPSIAPVQQGQLRALGVTLRQAVEALPQVPTVEQACALPGFESSTWYGLLAPPGLPAPILARMNAEVARSWRRRIPALADRQPGHHPAHRHLAGRLSPGA
ncbi:tripartite tricarboxylate transporter substrate-binding protein [Siccirubricoccus deserti]